MRRDANVFRTQVQPKLEHRIHVKRSVYCVPFAMLLAACQGGATSDALPGDPDDAAPYSEIDATDVVRFVGTEPFWGGQVSGTTVTYSTPDDADGVSIPVTRFAGRGGVSWAGTHEGGRFALAVTPGDCSDGMSDRRFPFVATLEVGGEQRSGCAWTDKQPYIDENPAVE